MPFISLATLIAQLGDTFKKSNDIKYWSGWIEADGKTRKITAKAVDLEESGLHLTIDDNGTAIKLAAVPDDLTHTKVLVNDVVQDGAALIFAAKPSPFNLTRFAFDFKGVQLSGTTVRINTRFDP